MKQSIRLLWLLAWAFLILGLLHCESAPTRLNVPLQLQTEGGRLLDAKGREVLLRGFNARIKGVFDVTFDDGRKPLEPIPPFTGEDCQRIATELGHNLLRLPINWSGIEPQKGQYNQAYLDRVWAVVDACYAHGVYSIVDLHQDAYSKEIGEDGAPLWAIVPKPEKLLEGPLHDLADRRTSKQVLDAFESLWDNKEGLQDAYAAMAAHLSKQLIQHPGAVGLEIMNEPVLFKDYERLDAFHQKVGEAAQKVAPGLALFFEPNSLRNLFDQIPVTTPFPLKNGVYSPHIYTQVFQDGWASGDEDAIRRSVEAAKQEAAKHKAPVFVGEFGNDPKTANGRRWIEVSMGLFDQIHASWAFWVYEEWSQGGWGLYDNGNETTRGALRPALLALLARPFPALTAGRLKTIKWDATNKQLTVTITAATDEWHQWTVPTHQYPKGIELRCDDNILSIQPAAGRATFRCKGSTITMRPSP